MEGVGRAWRKSLKLTQSLTVAGRWCLVEEEDTLVEGEDMTRDPFDIARILVTLHRVRAGARCKLKIEMVHFGGQGGKEEF